MQILYFSQITLNRHFCFSSVDYVSNCNVCAATETTLVACAKKSQRNVVVVVLLSSTQLTRKNYFGVTFAQPTEDSKF